MCKLIILLHLDRSGGHSQTRPRTFENLLNIEFFDLIILHIIT